MNKFKFSITSTFDPAPGKIDHWLVSHIVWDYDKKHFTGNFQAGRPLWAFNNLSRILAMPEIQFEDKIDGNGIWESRTYNIEINLTQEEYLEMALIWS